MDGDRIYVEGNNAAALGNGAYTRVVKGAKPPLASQPPKWSGNELELHPLQTNASGKLEVRQLPGGQLADELLDAAAPLRLVIDDDRSIGRQWNLVSGDTPVPDAIPTATG